MLTIASDVRIGILLGDVTALFANHHAQFDCSEIKGVSVSLSALPISPFFDLADPRNGI